MNERFALIVACDLNRGIGKNNSLPWKLKADLAHFKRLTTQTSQEGLYNAVIMGRRTWESIPPQFKPLAGRYNVVITRNENYQVPDRVFRCSSIDAAMELLSEGPVDQVFIAGGSEIYAAAMAHERVGLLYLTEIRQQFDCDTFFPDYKSFFQLISSSEILDENGIEFCFKVYKPNLLA